MSEATPGHGRLPPLALDGPVPEKPVLHARPKQFFPPGYYPYFIKDVTGIGFASFPSGHTTSIFALVTLMAIFSRGQKIKIACLLCGVLVGYSRIYLGQHFLGDVLTGSCIGTITAVLVHWIFVKKLQTLPLFAKG